MAFYDEVTADSPYGWFKHNDTSGSDIHNDGSGGSSSYTASGSSYTKNQTAFDTDTVKAIHLGSGGSSYVNLGTAFQSSNVKTNNALTLEALVKVSSSWSSTGCILRENANGNGYWLRIRSPETSGFRFDGAVAWYSDTICMTNDLDFDTWYHVVYTYDTNGSAIYVNGELHSSKSLSSYNSSTSSGTVSLWAAAVNWERLTHTTVDEFVVYRQALSETRIQAHAEALGLWTPPGIFIDADGPANITVGGKTALPNPDPYEKVVHDDNPVGYWRLSVEDSPNYSDYIKGDSPVSYWRLGESSGTTAADEMGLTDGTYTGNITYSVSNAEIETTTDTAVSLAGSDDYILIADTDEHSVNNSGNGFSVEAWVKLDTTSLHQAIVCKGDTVGGWEWNLWHHNSTGFQITVWDAGGTDISRSSVGSLPTAGQWYHLVAVVDDTGENAVLYVNGTAYSSVDAAGTTYTNGSAPINIGRRNHGDQDLDGTVDEVAIYDYKLTSTQVSNHYQNSKILARDEIGSNHGTYYGSPTTEATGALTTSSDSAVTFDGTDDYVDIDATTLPSGTAARSWEAWVKTSTLSYMFMAMWGTGANNGYDFQLSHESDGNLWGRFYGAGITYGALNTGEWYHIVAVFPDSGVSGDVDIYVNGTLRTATLQGGSLTQALNTSTDNNFKIGYGSTGKYNGDIDEVAIYDYVLTQSQIQAHYDAGQSLSVNPTATGPASISIAGQDATVSAFSPNAEAIADGPAAITITGLDTTVSGSSLQTASSPADIQVTGLAAQAEIPVTVTSTGPAAITISGLASETLQSQQITTHNPADTSFTNATVAMRVSFDQDFDLSNMYFYKISTGSGGYSINAVIYTDSGTKIAETPVSVLGQGAGWRGPLTFSSPVSLTAGTVYRIGFYTSSGSGRYVIGTSDTQLSQHTHTGTNGLVLDRVDGVVYYTGTDSFPTTVRNYELSVLLNGQTGESIPGFTVLTGTGNTQTATGPASITLAGADATVDADVNITVTATGPATIDLSGNEATTSTSSDAIQTATGPAQVTIQGNEASSNIADGIAATGPAVIEIRGNAAFGSAGTNTVNTATGPAVINLQGHEPTTFIGASLDLQADGPAQISITGHEATSNVTSDVTIPADGTANISIEGKEALSGVFTSVNADGPAEITLSGNDATIFIGTTVQLTAAGPAVIEVTGKAASTDVELNAVIQAGRPAGISIRGKGTIAGGDVEGQIDVYLGGTVSEAGLGITSTDGTTANITGTAGLASKQDLVYLGNTRTDAVLYQ